MEWPIAADCASVAVASTVFDTEERYDFVTIQGVQYSGGNAIDTTVPAGNFVVKFNSDGSSTKGGFTLLWRCLETITAPATSATTSVTTPTTTEATTVATTTPAATTGPAATTPSIQATTESGEIRHENYSDNEDLEWPITTNCNEVRLWSTAFDTETNYDYVTIESQRYSGTTGITVTVPAGNFVVQFHSDGSSSKTGFVLLWECEVVESQSESSEAITAAPTSSTATQASVTQATRT